MGQPYEATHPWLSLSFDISGFGPQEWVSFGRAQAGCAHLTGTPLRPGPCRTAPAHLLEQGRPRDHRDRGQHSYRGTGFRHAG